MKKYIGIDLGGTKVSGGLVLPDGRIIREKRLVFGDPCDNKKTLRAITALIDSLIDKDVAGIGIGIPAIPDGKPFTSTTRDSPNLKLLEHVDLKQYIKNKYRKPVMLDNDANCFIIGEHLCGSAKGYGDCVGLTLGTGIGCGMILGNKLRRGATWHCGEIFDIKTGKGILENKLSGKFIARNSGTRTAQESFELAYKGDRRSAGACRAWGKYGRWLGWTISVIQRIIDPEIFVLGGSLSNGYRLFRNAMHTEAGKTAPVKVSGLKEKAGIIGAGAMFRI